VFVELCPYTKCNLRFCKLRKKGGNKIELNLSVKSKDLKAIL
jgi:hypothetical protein